MKSSRKKFTLILSECERCGRSLYTGNRSLFGNDALKKKFGVICQDCTTTAEKEKLREEQGRTTTREGGLNDQAI